MGSDSIADLIMHEGANLGCVWEGNHEVLPVTSEALASPSPLGRNADEVHEASSGPPRARRKRRFKVKMR